MCDWITEIETESSYDYESHFSTFFSDFDMKGSIPYGMSTKKILIYLSSGITLVSKSFFPRFSTFQIPVV